MPELLSFLLFAGVCAALLAGFPVALTLGGVALGFAAFGQAIGALDGSFLLAMPQRIYAVMTNDVLVTVPLFIFMGTLLERSRLAEDLLRSLGQVFQRLRGGLGISITLVGALLAASTGIVGATVVTMGLLSLPGLLRQGYDPKLASGIITAAGTLGQIIPPSIILVLLGDVMGNAYQQAQLAQGIFAPQTVSVGELFAGALVPGLILVALYILYQFAVAWWQPERAPAAPPDGAPLDARIVLKTLIAPLVLIVAVLGSILGGVASPSEAASVGATGTIFLAAIRRYDGHWRTNLSLWGGLALAGLLLVAAPLNWFSEEGSWSQAVGGALALLAVLGLAHSLILIWRQAILQEVLLRSAQITSMVFLILIGAALFSLVFRGFGGDASVQALLSAMPGERLGALVLVMLIMFLLGFVLDFIEITLIVVPIVAPILLAAGIDPVWLGVMFALNLQTSFLTPPFGFALFYLRGVTPPSIRTSDIYRGAVPFIVIQLLMLMLLALVPEFVLWLPQRLF